MTVAHKTPEYRSWASMKQRCQDLNATGYTRYGGRGIRVCVRWARSFRSFLADMGPRPRGHTLDRIDNDGDYKPSNCRWASLSDQARNRRFARRTPRRPLTAFGRTKAASVWAEEYGISLQALNYRLSVGWSAEEALTRAKCRHVGASNGNARLTPKSVIEIRASRSTTAQLAKKYGVSEASIRNVVTYRTWRTA